MDITATIKDILKTLLSQPNYDRVQAGKFLHQLRELCADNRGLWSAYLREIFHNRKDYRLAAKRLIGAYLSANPTDTTSEILTPDTTAPKPSDLIIISNDSAVDSKTGELLPETAITSPPRGVILPDIVQEYKDLLDWCLNAPKNSTEFARRRREVLKWSGERWEKGEARHKGYVPFARSESTLYRHLDFVKRSGAAGLRDERGKQNDGPRLSEEEVERWKGFILTHLDTPNVNNKRARQTRRRVTNLRGLHRMFLRQYPDSVLTYRQARDIYKRMPSSWFKTSRQLRTEHARGNEWLNPCANHTWSFDVTDSSRYVRYVNEQGQIEIFKPEIGVIVDEYAGVFCALIFAEPASRDQLASLIYRAALPKEECPMQGLPENLHGDRGAIQRSAWLATLHEYYQRAAGVELLKTALNSTPFSPYKNGHSERVIRMVKEDFFPNFFDTIFPDAKPVINKRSGEVLKPPRTKWDKLPSIEQAQLALDEWTEMAVREIENSQSGMTRAEVYEACRLQMLDDNPKDPRLRLPDYDLLRKVLLQKDEAVLVEGGFIKYRRLTFRSPELQEYADNYGRTRVKLWFDPNDMRTALVFDLDGSEICTARADAPFMVGDKFSLKRWSKIQKANRDHRKAIRQATETVKRAVEEGGRTDIADEVAAAKQRAALQSPRLSLVDDKFTPTPQQEETLSSEQPGIIQAMQILRLRRRGNDGS